MFSLKDYIATAKNGMYASSTAKKIGISCFILFLV